MTASAALDPMASTRQLPAHYPRHAPDRDQLRAAIEQLAADHRWASLSWTELIEALLGLGRTDIPLARLVEGHADAIRTAEQASVAVREDVLYGVWASRSGDTGLRAEVDKDQLILTGVLKFASGAGIIDRALVPVSVDDEHQLLVDLAVDGLPVDETGWQTSAMTVSHTHTVPVAGIRVAMADVIGDRDFYLERPGFFPGGIGVAAVWAGGISRVLDALLTWLGGHSSPATDVRLGRLGTYRQLATGSVREAGRRLDAVLVGSGSPPRADLQELATVVRAGVAHCVHAALDEARTIAGPAGLALDAALTHAIADLDLYVRQHNTDADSAFLGTRLRA